MEEALDDEREELLGVFLAQREDALLVECLEDCDEALDNLLRIGVLNEVGVEFQFI